MMSTSIMVCDDRTQIAARALDLLVTQLNAAIRLRGEAHLALTGGSSAASLFTLLLTDAVARRTDWSRVHVWQGDERFVPHEHPDSNWAGALRGWLELDGGPAIPAAHLHPMPVAEAIAGGHDAAWAAERYAAEIEHALPLRKGLPAFDVILLGVGSDGHILSAFPESSAVADDAPIVTAVPAPLHIEPHLPRVTLVPRLLMAAGTVLVMIPGSSKEDVVRACFDPTMDVQHLPAQWALRPNALWLLDRDSAADL